MRKLIWVALGMAAGSSAIAGPPPPSDFTSGAPSPEERRQERLEAIAEYRELQRLRQRPYPAPYAGWKYQVIRPGDILLPVFWGPQYVIDIVASMLPAPPAYERWIRYGNDLVRVNTQTGGVSVVSLDGWPATVQLP